MKVDWVVKGLLATIAISLGAIAVRPYVAPPVVSAQTGEVHPLYFEPGTFMLRAPDGSQQVYGKVAIDMRNGKIWGFPTFTQDPYPSNPTSSTPPTSRPFLLGKVLLWGHRQMSRAGGISSHPDICGRRIAGHDHRESRKPTKMPPSARRAAARVLKSRVFHVAGHPEPH